MIRRRGANTGYGTDARPMFENEENVNMSLKKKSEKLKSILKGVWAFCSYVFVPQRRPKEN